MKKTYGAGGETFFSPGPVSGQGNIDKYDKWRSNLKPGGTQGFTTEDIRRGLGAPQVSTGQPSTSTDATPQGDKRLTTVGNYKLGGDQRRGALIQAAGEASKNLPPGWRVEAYSGQRDQGPHSYGGAIDFRLIDPQGHELPNYQDPKYYGIYEKFAQDTHLALQKTNPELAAQHRWGGYFSGPLGPNGQYGAMDLMHQDFAGGDARMAAGQWKTGINSEWRQRWGVTDYSSGIADRARSNTATLAPTPDQAAPAVVDQSGQVRQPAGPETNQANRPYRLQGQVALGGKTFDWASGGHARGSLPYGSYPINIGQGDIGPVGQQIGSVATVGGKGGVIDDPKYPGAPRTGIQIHSWSAPSLDKLYSDGCFTVPTEEWPAFKKALLDEAAKHPEGLSLTVNRNNTASIEPYHVARERAENQTGKDEQAPTMKYDKPPAWPKEGSKPIQYAGSTDDHDSAPKNKVKIEHNDSDHDIHVQENATSDLSTAPI
jgi:hypothetical protein